MVKVRDLVPQLSDLRFLLIRGRNQRGGPARALRSITVRKTIWYGERDQRRVAAALLLISSTLYFVTIMPVSPVYILISTYILWCTPRLFRLSVGRKDMYIFFHTIVLMLYLSFLAVIGVLQGQSGVLLQTYGNIILGLSMITVLLPGANLIDRAKLASSSIFGLYGILIVNAVDTIARIMKWRPLGYEHLQAIHDNPDLWFYEYKYGFMFNDSNQNGILMVGILCLSLAILHFTGRGKMAVFLCLVLLAATLSRAAWAAGAAVVLLRLLISRPIAPNCSGLHRGNSSFRLICGLSRG